MAGAVNDTENAATGGVIWPWRVAAVVSVCVAMVLVNWAEPLLLGLTFGLAAACVPAGSLLVLAASVVALTRRRLGGSAAAGRCSLALLLVGVAVLALPFALPRTLHVADMVGVRGAVVTASGDLLLHVVLREEGIGPHRNEAIAVRRHGEDVLRCLSRRPMPLLFSSFCWLVVSPDGAKVAVPEDGIPLKSLFGWRCSVSARGVQSASSTTLFQIDTTTREDERGRGTLLGPGKAWAMATWREVRGSLTTGEHFAFPLPSQNSPGDLWITGSELHVFEPFCERPEKAGSEQSCLVTMSLLSGRWTRTVIPLTGNVSVVSRSPRGDELVLRGFSRRDGATTGWYRLDKGRTVQTLPDPPSYPPRLNSWGWFTPQPQVVWRATGPVFLPADVDNPGEVREIRGTLLAVRNPSLGCIYFGSELSVLDGDYRTRRRIADSIYHHAWLDDSIVFVRSLPRPSGNGTLVGRYWPAEDRVEELLTVPSAGRS